MSGGSGGSAGQALGGTAGSVAGQGGSAAGKGGTSTGGAGAGTGGAMATGGSAGKGGTSGSAGLGAGGMAGSAGNSNGGGGATAGAGSGGMAGSGGGGAGMPGGSVFSDCRFHFGTIDSKASDGGDSLIAELDFFTPGWMLGDSFDQQYVCDATEPGGELEGKIPVVVAYLAAGIVKRRHGLCDCNVTTCGANNDLCHQGAARVQENMTEILDAYVSYSRGYANCYGTTKPIIFAMEPDFYQYTGDDQTAPWTPGQAGENMTQFVQALRSMLPNARFSLDVSPWVAPNNGSDHGADWFSNFDMSLFTFVSTSGGGTNADTEKIRDSNNMTWAGLRQASGKPILADTGYGANGVSAGEDPNWNVAANINARIADGVVAISQYNPSSSWRNTISGVRGQLDTPPFCP